MRKVLSLHLCPKNNLFSSILGYEEGPFFGTFGLAIASSLTPQSLKNISLYTAKGSNPTK